MSSLCRLAKTVTLSTHDERNILKYIALSYLNFLQKHREEWDVKQVIALAVVTWATEHNVEDN